MAENNPRILSNILINISENQSKQSVLNELNKVDLKMFELYGSTCHSIPTQSSKTFYETCSLGIPKNNSLTDSLLKSTFGCEEKLANSYLQILDQSSMVEEEERKKRIQEAKSKFAESNNFKDFCANSKPYKNSKNISYQKTNPVIDNQHDSYLKTQLIFLEKPQGNPKINEKQYFNKHIDTVTKKLNEIGGMEDTIKNMEQSLSKNELKNVKKKSIFTSNPQSYNPSGLKTGGKKSSSLENDWVEKSRIARETFMNKLSMQ